MSTRTLATTSGSDPGEGRGMAEGYRTMAMDTLQASVDGLPNLSGSESVIERAVSGGRDRSRRLAENPLDFGRIRAASAIALHMHQPLIPAGGRDLRTAGIIGNLQTLM